MKWTVDGATVGRCRVMRDVVFKAEAARFNDLLSSHRDVDCTSCSVLLRLVNAAGDGRVSQVVVVMKIGGGRLDNPP